MLDDRHPTTFRQTYPRADLLAEHLRDHHGVESPFTVLATLEAIHAEVHDPGDLRVTPAHFHEHPDGVVKPMPRTYRYQVGRPVVASLLVTVEATSPGEAREKVAEGGVDGLAPGGAVPGNFSLAVGGEEVVVDLDLDCDLDEMSVYNLDTDEMELE